MNAKCPRCSAPITSPPNERGLVQCAGCGAWLRSVASPAAAPPPPPEPSAPQQAAVDVAPASAPVEPPTLATLGPSAEILALTGEIRDLRRMQAEILQLQAQILTALRSWPAAPAAARHAAPTDVPETDSDDGEPPHASAPQLPRVRQRRKTVLVVDDDPRTLLETVAALEQAQVPVRSAPSGHAGMATIAADKPDVIVLELDLGEPMPGRDFVNTLKATMEWVDVRLVLHTRLPVASALEARVQHGADDFVLKGPGSAQAVVNRVIGMFQAR